MRAYTRTIKNFYNRWKSRNHRKRTFRTSGVFCSKSVLIVALCLVIAAFAYTPKEHRIEKARFAVSAPVEEEITEITRQDQKPPEPPKKSGDRR